MSAEDSSRTRARRRAISSSAALAPLAGPACEWIDIVSAAGLRAGATPPQASDAAAADDCVSRSSRSSRLAVTAICVLIGATTDVSMTILLRKPTSLQTRRPIVGTMTTERTRNLKPPDLSATDPTCGQSLRFSVTKLTFSNKLDLTLVGKNQPFMGSDNILKKIKNAATARLSDDF
jgi:hypothetical protein